MKTVIEYLIMVGLPLIGVFALLQVGEQLTPPISVGGEWHLETESETVDQTSCWQLFTWPAQPAINISQSGLFLQQTLNDASQTVFSGELVGTAITASSSDQAAISSRKRDTANTQSNFYLKLVVDQQSEPDRLSGTLSGDNCVSTSITGIRQPVTVSNMGDH